MRKRILSMALLAFFLFMSVLPMAAYAAAPKEGDYVDPVEYYDLKQFAGMQLTAESDIRKAILDKEFVPVELVLEPLALDYGAIRMAIGNSHPPEEKDTYPFDGEKWTLKAGEKSSYAIKHSGSGSGYYDEERDKYNWEWNAEIALAFDNVMYYIEDSKHTGKYFNLVCETMGTASSRGSKIYDGAENSMGNTNYSGEFTFKDSIDGRIDWYVDDNGILKVYLRPRCHAVEKWVLSTGEQVSDVEDSKNQANIWFKVASVKLGKNEAAPGAVQGKAATRADKDSGETSVPIPEALAIVIIGGAAAMAGAGAGGRSGDGGDNNSKKKSRYKMCLRKDFGDAIRYDTQPVTVYARMVEITSEGEEIDRPDLTASMEIFSGGNLTVEGNSMAGNYMGALVSAQSAAGGQYPGEGIVSIKFSGEGGSFQNDVTFRLIGKPYISFPGQGSYLNMTLPMLSGDGETYETAFILNDFLEKPTLVKQEVGEDAPLDCEIEETGENQYILKVKNNSTKSEGHQAIKQTFSIGIRAENEQELAEDSLNVELYPEGLSIREVNFDENGYALIETFDNEATEEWGDVKPTGFVLDFVVLELDQQGRRKVRVLEPEEFSPGFASLKGTDERTTRLAERFKYNIEEIVSNLKEYKFAPREALVEEEGKPYFLTLPISCTHGDQEYTLDLPLHLLGGGPEPLAGWEEAFINMKRVVGKVGGISPEIARLLRENGKKMSTAELRLVTKRICHDAIVYYTQDAAEYEKIAAELDNMIYYAEWLKWFGDQAFSYLISTYYGNTADAILSPAKDIFASFLGEVIGQLAYGETFNWETLEVGKNINATFDNLITNVFDDKMGKKVSFKQVCAVVGGFVVWKIAKNIYDNMDKDGKVDLYSAITATTSDLTVMGMKKIAGSFFDKALKNKAVQENLNTPLGKWLQDLVPDSSLVKWGKGSKGKDAFKMIDFNKSDIFKKYLEEIFGMGMAKVTEIDMAAVKGSMESTLDLSAWPQIDWTTVTTEENGNQEAYKISVNLGLEALGRLYDYLFGELFGNVPFAGEEKQPPADPPYKPEGSLA